MERNPTPQKSHRLVNQIAGEAADWFARLQDADAPASDREEFTQWLLRSPTHIEEYLAITRLWGDVDASPKPSIDELIRQASESNEPDNVFPIREQETAKPTQVIQRRQLWPIAASLLVAIGGGFIALNAFDPSRIETGVGEQRSVTLSDGSVLHLNTHSEVRIDLDDRERRINLIRGEARFTVAKDAKRPFFVTTPQATVRAVGTVFNVRATGERTAVTVIEGRVAVNQVNSGAGATATPAQTLELTAGQQAEVTAQGEILPDVGPSVERVLAWPERRLVFRDDPLADVVAEFNRYHERPIRIEDPTLAAIRISGIFNATDPQSLIQYLERYENVKTRNDPDGVQYLTR